MSQEQLTSTNIHGSSPPKPQRPLTRYNLFAILERNYIVQQNQKPASIPPDAPSDGNTDPYASTRPARYRDVVLPSNWFVVGMNRVKRSKHEKHGVISFNDLTKEISHRWKAADAETKQYCEMIAADELERYRRDLAAYKAMYGKDAVETQKRKHKEHDKSNEIADNNEALGASKEDDSGDNSQRKYSIGSRFCETETAMEVEVEMKVGDILNKDHKPSYLGIQKIDVIFSISLLLHS
ncbi:hypothetical protein HJC23_009690 [Cyclotella cryptica]|uniref:HMG box domain-containing protein n=1 Tax=Cyclotella cryptica TaxID=29204 RepID=A0ABD3Q9H2_9STRA